MAAPKILDLLHGLSRGTEQHRIHWEDLPDEEMFRTQIARSLIRIGKSDPGYSLWLYGPGAQLVAETTLRPGEEGYEVMEELYANARLNARNGDALLAEVMSFLP
jgi:hypothetical protein